jgi:hypothetical protein
VYRPIATPFALVIRYLLYRASWLAWRADRSVAWLRQGVSKAWFFFVVMLGLEGIRQRANSAQGKAVDVVEQLTDAVRLRTTWFGRLFQWLESLRALIHRSWIAWMSWAEQTWLRRVISWPLRRSATIAFALYDFLMMWLGTRTYRQLLLCIPAALLLMPLAYCGVRLPFQSPAIRAQQYRRVVDTAMAENDHALAELCFRKLTQLGDVHESVALREAWLAEEQSDFVAAYDKMRPLAPLDAPGVVEAHLWIARAIAAGHVEKENKDRLRILETHLPMP